MWVYWTAEIVSVLVPREIERWKLKFDLFFFIFLMPVPKVHLLKHLSVHNGFFVYLLHVLPLHSISQSLTHYGFFVILHPNKTLQCREVKFLFSSYTYFIDGSWLLDIWEYDMNLFQYQSLWIQLTRHTHTHLQSLYNLHTLYCIM